MLYYHPVKIDEAPTVQQYNHVLISSDLNMAVRESFWSLCTRTKRSSEASHYLTQALRSSRSDITCGGLLTIKLPTPGDAWVYVRDYHVVGFLGPVSTSDLETL